MPANLSIKNAPDEVVARLKERAARHHRSLQGELMDIICKAACEPRRESLADVLSRAQALGLPEQDGSADIIRQARDARRRD